jgi:hypothetical protein
MRRKFLVMAFFLLAGLNAAFAQQLIKGRVKDGKGKPVSAASVNLKDKEGNIISFTRTDDKGNYALSFDEKNKGFTIEATMIGYTKQVIAIAAIDQVYEFTLVESEINLQTVVVKNRPSLVVKGDTLNYKTSDFADKQDRSIGDVLRKMPGIEVDENGKVTHNGKAISALYIDGDNVLDDKYSIGTKSIPHGVVEKVQVIENDQPIKMLRKNNMSDDVALNLVIKDDAKLKMMGDIKAGLGTPDRFDGNVNAMMFKNKFKFINSLKGNNVGIDPGIDLTSFNMADYQKRIDNDKPGSFLSAGAAGVPTLPQSRSLFNKAGLINLNNLYKFNEDFQFKANIGYLYDQRNQQFSKFSETYLPTDTIAYSELQDNSVRPQKLQAKLNLNGNSESFFLNNTLMADYAPYQTNSLVNINGIAALQQLHQETFDISNEFSYRKKLKSAHTLNFYSFLNSTTQPEELRIRPGLNEALLNNGNAYAGLNQYVKLPTLYANNFMSFALVNGRFVQTYKVGFNVQHQKLDTELYRIQNDQTTELVASEMTNDLAWNKNKSYVEAGFEYSNDKIKAGLFLPLSYNNISYQDDTKGLAKKLNKVFLNPSFNLKYQTSAENYLSINYSFKNDLGGIEDVYRGTVLKNYRSLFANDAPISERSTHAAGATFNFRRAIQMFFMNFNVGYNKTSLNTISSFILTNTIQQRVVLPLANELTSLSFGANASKYLFNLKTTVNIGASYNRTTFDQLQNNNLLPFQSAVMSYKAGADAKITNYLNWSYNATFSESSNKAKTETGLTTRFQQLRHTMGLTATTFKSLFVNVAAEHIFTHQGSQPNLSYLFADINLRYKFIKYKTDLEFGITNLANVKKFEAIYISANSLTSGTYYIPGRVAMLKATFSF